MISFRKSLPAALAAGALALGPLTAQATTAPVTIRLFTPSPDVTMTVHHSGPDEWVEFNPAVYVKAPSTRFEIDVRRPSYAEPLAATVRVGDRTVTLSRTFLDGWSGLKNAFVFTWRTPAGTQLSRTPVSWCPNDGQTSRLSASAAATTVFASGCGYHPFTRGQRWGIDRGWARQVPTYGVQPPEGALGDHAVLEIALRKDLANLLEVPESNRTLRFDVTVEHVTDPDPEGPGAEPETETGAVGPSVTSSATSSRRLAPEAPRVTAFTPPADTLPDLISLPAFGMSTSTEGDRDYLNFAATVYNGGRGPLVAEGYRRGADPEMDAYQMFYRGTRLLGSARVGTMEYDVRDSHEHWHFEDFAIYDLVDQDRRALRTSGKEAFCLAPTDAINLLIPGAAVDPGNGDLSTACGEEESIWVREVLASGWGDTYLQQRAGQAIDITGLPNGTYWVRVRSNPGNRLREASRLNNVSLRRVVLGGTSGDRNVSVPAYGVIDTEGFFGEAARMR